MERKVSEIAMLEIDEVRNAVENLQIDAYQLSQKIERLEEKLEILELKLNEILEVIGKTNVY